MVQCSIILGSMALVSAVAWWKFWQYKSSFAYELTPLGRDTRDCL